MSDKPLEVEVLDNSLVKKKNLSVNLKPADEIAKKIELVEQVESLTTLRKQQLAVEKNELMLDIDERKLKSAKKIMQSMENIADILTDKDVVERLKANTKKPLDAKLLSDAFTGLANSLKNLQRPDSLDEMGTKKHQKINFFFKSNGNSVQAAVQIDNSNNDE